MDDFQKAVRANPDFEALYYGACHGEPAAPELIDSLINYIEKDLCQLLGVASFDPYESDGGLKEAISYNLAAILRAANVMDEENIIARHKGPSTGAAYPVCPNCDRAIA